MTSLDPSTEAVLARMKRDRIERETKGTGRGQPRVTTSKPKQNGASANGHHARHDEPPPVNGPEDFGIPTAAPSGSTQRLDDGPQGQSDGIPLRHFDDCNEAQAAKRWHIKHILAENETTLLIGPPGSGKSAIAADICMHYPQADMWRGHRVKQHGAAVYFAFERADLVERRFHAQRKRDKLRGPFCISIAGKVIDLMKPGCVKLMLATLKAAEKRHGRRVGLAVIDTYNKGIAAGGGDEDKAKDQNRALGHIRKLQEAYPGLAVLVIGHTGKNEDKGPRGSNASTGDADALFQISSSGEIKTITTVKANDAPEGELLSFRLERIVVGVDEDGDEEVTYIVDRENLPTQQGKSKQKQSAGRMGRGKRVLLDAIIEVLDGQAEPIRIANGEKVAAARVDRVQAEFNKRYVVAENGSEVSLRDDAKRKALNRAFENMPEGFCSITLQDHQWIYRLARS